MYARFDIVWPDGEHESDLRVGVDALAFGLGTLAMSGSIFGPRTHRILNRGHGGAMVSNGSGRNLARRRVDNYAQFTRKFSLGDGPSNFVSSYYISTESGKMLGTLVALAVARMRNLESFVWDMPTGIIREAWEALSSLGHDSDGHQTPTNLESVWVRCHDSKVIRAPSQNSHFFLPINELSARYDLLRDSFRQIEHPNFSILPPLKSISVLCIDELAYFEELSILLLNSLGRLRELRIGISEFSELAKKRVDDAGEETFLNEPGSTALGANGVLGMLMSKICRCYRHPVADLDHRRGASHTHSVSIYDRLDAPMPAPLALPIGPIPSIVPGVPLLSDDTLPVQAPAKQESPPPIVYVPASLPASRPNLVHQPSRKELAPREGDVAKEAATEHENAKASRDRYERHRKEPPTERRLKLHVLALEHVPLSVYVLKRAIDWTVLTDITLLNCNSDEKLWGALSKAFPPQVKDSTGSSPTRSNTTNDYPLRLKRVHTTGVSAELIIFLRDTLAPNSLEGLFLQDRHPYPPGEKITINSIYKGPLRRHRQSLQKVSLGSGYGWNNKGPWKKTWLLNREALAFITSGKMSSLRELVVSVDHKDWVGTHLHMDYQQFQANKQ